MIRTMKATKPLQLIQRSHRFKRLGVQLQRRMGSVRPGASARRLLRLDGMGRGIGAQEEFVGSRCGGREQCRAMSFTFKNWKAVEVWFDATHQ